MLRRPKFGLALPNRAVSLGFHTPEDILQMAQLAESSGGFDHVWVGDTIMAKPRMESIVTMSAIAARTEQIRIGVGCMASFPCRNPVVLAYQWASLDVISNGRTILGACIGGTITDPANRLEYANMGIGGKDRMTRMEEGISVLRKLWTEDHVDFEGAFYTLKGAFIDPKPIQSPPPIWLVSNPRLNSAKPRVIDRALRRVARLGDGWMTSANSSDPAPEYKEQRQRIFEYAQECGRNFEELPCSMYYNINIKASQQEAIEESKRYLDRYYRTDHPVQYIADHPAAGPPQDCADQIRKLLDDGPTDILIRFPSPDQLGQIRLFAEEVLPHLA